MLKTIDDVILAIDCIVVMAKNENARYGYFASLYLGMTKAVKEGILKNQFEDGVRMETLCVTFAKRYLDAFEIWKAGNTPSEVWLLALNETKKNTVTALQHLLCSINAHINLDLGIAAAQVSSGKNLEDLKTDFDRINNVLASLLDDVQTKLGTLSWPLKWLDRIGKNHDEHLANFSLGVAREAAWQVALAYSKLHDTDCDNYIKSLDHKMSLLSKLIINPGTISNFMLKPVKWFEPNNPSEIIAVLNF